MERRVFQEINKLKLDSSIEERAFLVIMRKRLRITKKKTRKQKRGNFGQLRKGNSTPQLIHQYQISIGFSASRVRVSATLSCPSNTEGGATSSPARLVRCHAVRRDFFEDWNLERVAA